MDLGVVEECSIHLVLTNDLWRENFDGFGGTRDKRGSLETLILSDLAPF